MTQEEEFIKKYNERCAKFRPLLLDEFIEHLQLVRKSINKNIPVMIMADEEGNAHSTVCKDGIITVSNYVGESQEDSEVVRIDKVSHLEIYPLHQKINNGELY